MWPQLRAATILLALLLPGCLASGDQGPSSQEAFQQRAPTSGAHQAAPPPTTGTPPPADAPRRPQPPTPPPAPIHDPECDTRILVSWEAPSKAGASEDQLNFTVPDRAVNAHVHGRSHEPFAGRAEIRLFDPANASYYRWLLQGVNSQEVTLNHGSQARDQAFAALPAGIHRLEFDVKGVTGGATLEVAADVCAPAPA